MVAITPANNLLVEFSEFKMDLPLLTYYAIQLHTLTFIIPLSWIVITIIIGKRMVKLNEMTRTEWLSAHTSITLVVGLSLLLFFSLAGILPILKCYATLT